MTDHPTYPDLDGKAAVVTGAATGIGRVYAEALLGQGVAVTILDRDAGAVSATVAALAGAGARVLGCVADVTDPDALQAAAERTAHEFGRLDILVNNAGLHLPPWTTRPTLLPPADWLRLLEVNVVGIVNAVRACRPYLQVSGQGVVINQGSVAGHRPTSTYGVSKLAVRGLTVALAAELAPDGIRVVSLAPGPVLTEPVREHVPPERLAALVDQQLIKRLAEPGDLVGPLLFLCSTASAFVSAETVAVAGGYPLQV